MYMDTIYGESPELQTNDSYASRGIALYSIGEGDQTITGGSGNQGGCSNKFSVLLVNYEKRCCPRLFIFRGNNGFGYIWFWI